MEMQKSLYLQDIERQYGVAARFVQRAVDAYRNMVGFYNPTPNQCIFRLLAHLERIGGLGRSVITDQQREAARDAVFSLIEKAQLADLRYEGSDSQVEVPSGDAEYIGRAKGIEQSGVAARHRFHDSSRDPVVSHGRPDMHDERVSFMDPLYSLSKYRIRASEGLRTYLTPEQDLQFSLNSQHHIMEELRAIEKRHLHRTAARESARVAPR